MAGQGAVDGAEVVAEESRHSAAKTVDRLIGIADHHQPGTRIGWSDEAQQLELRRVDVLELVDQDKLELGAHPLAKPRIGFEELDARGDEVAEIEEPRLAHALLVCLVHGCQHSQPLACARLGRQLQGRGMDQVLLHQGDKRKQVMRERVGAAHTIEWTKRGRVDVREHVAHHDPFLEAVQEQAIPVGGVVAQDP